MHLRHFIALLTLLFIVDGAFAQPPRGERREGFGGRISGRVVDDVSGKPVEYANVVVYAQRDSSQLYGAAADSDGRFEITGVRPGRFFAKISFIGFEDKKIDGIALGRTKRELDLGNVRLARTEIMLEGAEVAVEKPLVEFQIDKKVINVDKELTSVSGAATDVLENAPSVNVDIEGNVSLRGSSSFTVMVNNVPSLMDPNDVLQQIPASSIENIEIITNPSVKFEPDGVSGIINIILKENKFSGVSGIIDANAGLHDRYGGDFFVSFRDSWYSFTLGADYNRRNWPGTETERSVTTLPDRTLYVNTSGDRSHSGERMGVRGSGEFSLTEKDVVNLGIRIGSRSHEHSSELDFVEWEDPAGDAEEYTSKNPSGRSGDFYSGNFAYFHQFAGKDHTLIAKFDYGTRGGDEESISELYNGAGAMVEGRKTTEKGPGYRINMELEYRKPFSEESKFEAGYDGSIKNSEDETEYYEFDLQADRYVLQPEYSHLSIYTRDTRALWSQYSNKFNRLGIQIGLRGEYTYRVTETDGKGDFKIDRWDYFPSLHSSFELNDRNQIMASYTRRIDRPRGWHLEPFETWMDPYNVRVGNPNLKPEYIDSYELGYQYMLSRFNTFTAEAFYRRTENKIERVRSVYSENITLNSTENVGEDRSLGAEFSLNLSLFKFWTARLFYDLFHYKVEGELYGRDFSRESFTWNVRFNNDFKLGEKMRVQFSGGYRSPSVRAQSETEGSFMSSLALRYEFIKNVLSSTLQIRDVFDTGKRESTTTGENYEKYSLFERESPFVTLTLTYNFNNFKKERNGRNGDDEFEMEDF